MKSERTHILLWPYARDHYVHQQIMDDLPMDHPLHDGCVRGFGEEGYRDAEESSLYMRIVDVVWEKMEE